MFKLLSFVKKTPAYNESIITSLTQNLCEYEVEKKNYARAEKESPSADYSMIMVVWEDSSTLFFSFMALRISDLSDYIFNI